MTNLVGGASRSARNVISGNAQGGIALLGPGTEGNLIQGNIVGPDITGTRPLPTSQGGAQHGILVDDAPRNQIGGVASIIGEPPGNVISANGEYGIALAKTNSVRTRIQGNLIGTDIAGVAPLGNEAGGISMQDV